MLHLAHSEAETSGEEWMTVAYLRDTADQAGLNTVGMTVEQIGFDHDLRRFVDHEGRVIQTCFKLYPWEDMLTDEFGERVLADPALDPVDRAAVEGAAVQQGAAGRAVAPLPRAREPAAGVPGPAVGHDVLDREAPARPGGRRDEVGARRRRAPLAAPALRRGRATATSSGRRRRPSTATYPVLGAWVVDGNAAGLGIRESDGPVTDYYARFVPHYIDAPTPGQDQRAAWLKEDGVKP